ncbi:MAG TPA: alpha/beta hydrolase [Candidatus Nanopelagicales bacterium]|nr:alpha/beta hydrolase [Candidatus Nanopelagicales bacterium]
MDLSSAVRVAGRGVAAAGVLAAGAAVGVLAERALIRRTALPDVAEDDDLGSLRGEQRELLTADGTALHVEVDEPEDAANADLTVVFAHGYALNQDSWHFQRKALRGRARLVFYDQRSHGRSGRAEPLSHHIDQLGVDLAAVLEAVAPSGPVILIGHSMGGMTVMAYAEEHPEEIGGRIRGIGLIATTAGDVAANSLGFPRPLGRFVQSVASPIVATLAKRSNLIDGWDQSDFGLLLTRLYSFGSPTSDHVGRFVAQMLAGTSLEVVAEFLPALHDHDKHDVLPILQKAEVLVIAGAKDRLTPPALSEDIVEQIPGAEFALLGEAGHMVMLERPNEVNDLIWGLVERVRRGLESQQGVA